jgi:hypothetical protein
MIVPHEIRGHSDESATRLAQVPREQQQLAQRLDVVDVHLVVVPFAVDLIGRHQRRGVVAGYGPRVFFREVECARHAPHDRPERLLAHAVEAIPSSRSIESESAAVELGQQGAAIAQPIGRNRSSSLVTGTTAR